MISGFFFGQAVAEFVIPGTHMAFDPLEEDMVFFHEAVDGCPQVPVQHRCALHGFPAVFLPFLHPPFGEGLLEVLAVGVEGNGVDCAVVCQFQGFIGRPKFHAVIGGGGLATG